MDGRCSYRVGAGFCYLVAEGSGGAATLQPAGVFAGALGSSEHARILERGSNVAYSDGHLLFVRENVLMAQPFDPERLELSGEARAVTDSIASAQFNTFLGTFSVSRSGLLAHQTEQREARARLQWFDRGGKPPVRLARLAISAIQNCRPTASGSRRACTTRGGDRATSGYTRREGRQAHD